MLISSVEPLIAPFLHLQLGVLELLPPVFVATKRISIYFKPMNATPRVLCEGIPLRLATMSLKPHQGSKEQPYWAILCRIKDIKECEESLWTLDSKRATHEKAYIHVSPTECRNYQAERGNIPCSWGNHYAKSKFLSLTLKRLCVVDVPITLRVRFRCAMF